MTLISHWEGWRFIRWSRTISLSDRTRLRQNSSDVIHNEPPPSEQLQDVSTVWTHLSARKKNVNSLFKCNQHSLKEGILNKDLCDLWWGRLSATTTEDSASMFVKLAELQTSLCLIRSISVEVFELTNYYFCPSLWSKEE